MRRLLLTAFALALTALLTSSVALAAAPPFGNDQAPREVTQRHFLKLYKVEQHVDIGDTEFKIIELPCTNSDAIATDGMWRIDQVDQDESGEQPLADIDVYAAYSKPTDPSRYVFEIYNNSEGRAQMKIFATCLGRQTEPNSHRHSWSLQHPDWRYFDYTRTLGQHAFGSGNAECGPNEIAISPGYEWRRGFGELYKSTAITGAVRGWEWGFFVTLLDDTTGDAQARVSFRCLKLRSSSVSGPPPHHHLIEWAFRPGFPLPLTQIQANTIETRTRTCGLHEKGMVHSFDLDPHLNGQNIWYLGQDPRIKKRAYKVKNPNPGIADVRFGVVCFNDRTGRKHHA